MAEAAGSTGAVAAAGSIDDSPHSSETMTDTIQNSALLSVSAAQARSFSDEELIVRVLSESDLDGLEGLDSERIAWVEVPLELAHREELNRFSVDVLLTDPRAQAAKLYKLAGDRDPQLPRLSIPTEPGFADAVLIAMGLHFPIRIIPIQPAEEQIVELQSVLQRYLHDGRATQPIEPFHSALSTLLHGEGHDLWQAVEYDPAEFRRKPPHPGLEDSRSADELRLRLEEGGAECSRCFLQSWCGGWFKWPVPDYDCSHVRGLFSVVEEAGNALRKDLQAAEEYGE